MTAEEDARAPLVRGKKALNAGNVEAALGDLNAAYDQALARRDKLLEAEALVHLARALELRGVHDQAAIALDNALAAARAGKSLELEAEARLADAGLRRALGDLDRARLSALEAARLLDDAFEVARGGGDPVRAVELASRGRAARELLGRLPGKEGGAAALVRRGDEARRDEGQRRADRALLEKLFEVARKLVHERDPEKVVDSVLEVAIETTGAERGFVLLSPEEGEPGARQGERELPEGLRVVAARNFDRAEVRKPEFAVSSTVIDQALAKGQPVLVRDASSEGAFAQQSSVASKKLRSIACIPFKSTRGVRGLLYLDNRFGEAVFSEADLPAFATFAAHAAIAVENARLHASAAREQKAAERARARAEDLAKQLEVKLAKTDDQLGKVAARLAETTSQLALRSGFGSIVGRSTAMQPIYKLLDRFKESDAPVLVRGESGTGKELIARALHFEGARKAGPFVGESCAAIPEGLLESTLFGHEPGAFTGATERRAGLFELASGGTLFLDEVGELTVACQAKLLRVLEEKKVRRLGGGDEIPVDVRVVAATNRDLETMVREGRFREDLLFRLNVLALRLPPLRERRDDIPALVARFLDKHAPGVPRPELPPQVTRALLNHSWPGNVRELENEVKRLLVLKTGQPSLEDLSPAVRGETDAPGAKLSGDQSVLTLEEAERRAILIALKTANGSKVRAADILGIPRTSLYHRLKHHGIETKDILED
jgi:transcriptional regulator with GAF, ATPase, and Fis domain